MRRRGTTRLLVPIEVTERDRAAIAQELGVPGPATDEQVKRALNTVLRLHLALRAGRP